ncbi:GxxExxY protein [Sorangium sp. So ce1504]|uniref:GxxExxY protein n=1 Tax=Sorangium sp. So ce1504 TaxID=3133337 RepID=UPI003F5E2F5D
MEQPEFNAKAQRRKGTKAQDDGEEMNENGTTKIVDAAFEVHRSLGCPGLLETVHEEALDFELES